MAFIDGICCEECSIGFNIEGLTVVLLFKSLFDFCFYELFPLCFLLCFYLLVAVVIIEIDKCFSG